MTENDFNIKTWLLDNLESLTDKVNGKNLDDISTQVQAEICKSVLTLEAIINNQKQ